MSRPFVCMLLQNRYDMDARVKREARTLSSDLRIRVLHLTGEGQKSGEYTDGEGGGEVEIDRFDLLTRGLPQLSLFWPIKLLEFVLLLAWKASRLRPDAYHAHDLPMVIAAYLASLFHRAPIIYDAHELYSETGQDPPFIASIWKRIDAWAVKRVQAVIAVNQSRADVMVEELGSPPPVIVPNYPLYKRFDELPSRENSPLRSFVDDQRGPEFSIVLYQGILAPGRDLAELIKAMAHVEARTILTLLGPRNCYVDELLSVVEQYGVEDRVLYHEGVNSDVLPHYTVGADVGVVTYANHPRNNYLCAPNKLFEYCMAGIPVVGCDFPEITRLLDEYAAGERFASGDPVSIAGAIDGLLGDPDRLQEARNLTHIVREHYHWERSADALHGIYNSFFENRK